MQIFVKTIENDIFSYFLGRLPYLKSMPKAFFIKMIEILPLVK